MKTLRMVGSLVTAAVVLVSAQERARAISLPDASSCNSDPSTNACLQISATFAWGDGIKGVSVLGSAVTGTATQSGIGVRGTTAGAYGVYGSTSGNGIGVRGTATAGGDGVYGEAYSGYGVKAYASALHSSAALYADAQNDGSITWAGYFVGDTSANGYYTNSDARLKKDVKDVPYGLAQLLKLHPVSYKWRKTVGPEHVQLGLIAQEAEKIVPELIRSDRTSGMLAVNYTALVPVMIKAIQEQEKVIERQEARIAVLEQQAAPLKASMFPEDPRWLAAFVLIGLLTAVIYRKRKTRAA